KAELARTLRETGKLGGAKLGRCCHALLQQLRITTQRVDVERELRTAIERCDGDDCRNAGHPARRRAGSRAAPSFEDALKELLLRAGRLPERKPCCGVDRLGVRPRAAAFGFTHEGVARDNVTTGRDVAGDVLWRPRRSGTAIRQAV